MDVRRVVDLRTVVERRGQLRKRQCVLAAVVLDLDEALLDIDVGRAVLAHRPELHQVAVRNVFAHREQEVERADDVDDLRLRRAFEVDHRKRRRGLLGVVDDGLRLEVGDYCVEERRVGDVADVRRNLLASDLVPSCEVAPRGCGSGSSESLPISVCQRRRAKLSTTATSCPRFEKCMAVGQPR